MYFIKIKLKFFSKNLTCVCQLNYIVLGYLSWVLMFEEPDM